MHKYIIYFFGLLFLVFAYIQLNDPDPLAWVTIYVLTGLLPITMLFWRKAKYGIYILTAVLLIMFFFYLPDFISWTKAGFPSINESMKAEKMYVELVREFLGIFICLLYLVGVLFFERKRARA